MNDFEVVSSIKDEEGGIFALIFLIGEIQLL